MCITCLRELLALLDSKKKYCEKSNQMKRQ